MFNFHTKQHYLVNHTSNISSKSTFFSPLWQQDSTVCWVWYCVTMQFKLMTVCECFTYLLIYMNLYDLLLHRFCGTWGFIIAFFNNCTFLYTLHHTNSWRRNCRPRETKVIVASFRRAFVSLRCMFVLQYQSDVCFWMKSDVGSVYCTLGWLQLCNGLIVAQLRLLHGKAKLASWLMISLRGWIKSICLLSLDVWIFCCFLHINTFVL